jgi:hypothetical protein
MLSLFLAIAIIVLTWIHDPMMSDPSQNASDWPPHFNLNGLPEAERRIARNLLSSLPSLRGFENDFRIALELFDYSDRHQKGWHFIAARDGAMTIFHFAKVLENMMASIGQCPTILALVDRDKFKKVRKNLRELFPRFEAVRHSVAHAGELMKDPETAESH